MGEGFLIHWRRTGEVRTAMGANLLVLIGVLAAGTRQTTIPGSLLAASGVVAGLLTEVSLLWRKISRTDPSELPT